MSYLNIMKNFLYTSIFSFLSFIPNYTFAKTTFRDATKSLLNVVGNALIPMLFSIALAWFIWGIVGFIRSSDNSEERKKGKSRIVWGILGLLAMVTYISLAGVITQTFFGDAPGLPQFSTQIN